jgi:transposase
MRFVDVKSQAQQEVLALHRVRALLIRERTALMNQMRGLLAESSIVVAQGAARLRKTLAEILGDGDQPVGEMLRETLQEMSERLRSFEERLERYDRQLGNSREDRSITHLTTVHFPPGPANSPTGE